MHDFTLFVIDIHVHQNMPISLTLTPFDHFQNTSSGGVGPDLILTLCHRLHWRDASLGEKDSCLCLLVKATKEVQRIPSSEGLLLAAGGEGRLTDGQGRLVFGFKFAPKTKQEDLIDRLGP